MTTLSASPRFVPGVAAAVKANPLSQVIGLLRGFAHSKKD